MNNFSLTYQRITIAGQNNTLKSGKTGDPESPPTFVYLKQKILKP